MTLRTLHGLSAGSSAATHLPTPLRELFEGHAPFVCRSLGYLGVPEDHLDAALRAVFSLVFQRLDEYQKQTSVRAWLYSLCTRVSRAHGYRGPSPQREAFLLSELEDMPLAEIAQALHCTPRTAYARLRAARTRSLELAALSGPMFRGYQHMDRDSRALWTKRIERWLESGLTAKEFAAELDVRPNSLAYWKSKLREPESMAGARPPKRKRETPSGTTRH